MRCVTFISLSMCTLIAQATVQEFTSSLTSHAQVSIDELADELFDRLIDRRMKTLVAGSDMDKTTLAKTQAPVTLAKPQGMASSVPAMQKILKSHGMGSSPLEKLALTAIGATRDVSMAAQVKEAFSSLDLKTREKFATVRAAVEIKGDQVRNNMAGITPPVGFSDPVGWTTKMPDAGTLLFLREAKLKHGRVGMLASLGMIVDEKYHPLFGSEAFPHFGSLKDLGALQQTNYETFWAATFLACGAVEIWGSINKHQPFQSFSGYKIKDGRSFGSRSVPGNLGYDPLGMREKPKDPKAFKEMQDKELNNGRLAMLAAAGIIAQEMVSGGKIL